MSVPPNTTAEVWIPEAREKAHAVGGSAALLRREDGCAVFAAGSGTHRFTG